MNFGAQPQLENWKDGIMGFGELKKWFIERIKSYNRFTILNNAA
jgi:flagellar assembly factor FliW